MEPSKMLLDWRARVAEAQLEGAVRVVAVTSEVLELDNKHVLLRPTSHVLATRDLARSMALTLSKESEPFEVLFTEDLCQPTTLTVSHIEEKERSEARKALVEAFRSDPFVQECLTKLDAVVLEETVMPREESEKEKEK